MRCCLMLAVAAIVFGWAGTAVAQFGNGSAQGGRTTSSSSGSFGSTSRGGSIGNANRSFAGQSGQGGTGGRGGMDASGAQAGQLNGNERFTRQGRQQGSFVGRDQQDMQGFVGALNALSGQNGQNGQNRMNQNRNMGGQGRNGQGEDFFDNQAVDQLANQRKFRTKVVLGFKPKAQPVSVITTGLSTRLGRVMGRSVGSAVRVELADGTAILTGTVPTSEEKSLAESLAMLEPGIAQVQNDLVVAAAAASESTNSQ